MRVFDWASATKYGWFISDGTHYTSTGYAQRAPSDRRRAGPRVPRHRDREESGLRGPLAGVPMFALSGGYSRAAYVLSLDRQDGIILPVSASTFLTC